MRKIRVLHLLTSLGAGGAETNLLALAQFYDTDMFQHAVAFGGGGSLKKEFEKTNMELIQILPEPVSLRSYFGLKNMGKKIEQYSPDIIHSHLDLVHIIGLRAKSRLSCKLLLHLHDSGIIPRNQIPGRGSKHLIWSVLNKTYKYSDKIIAICSFQLPFLERLGIDPSRIVVIPNGINPDGEVGNANTITVEDQRKGYCFINVGRFYKEKGHEILVQAFHAVNKTYPETYLTLVGDGPLRKDIERQVAQLELRDRITFAGVRRDVPELLRLHDCFVLSSLWELQPITILEAMRAGLPVITTDVGGVRDMVVEGENGLLAKLGDAEDLSRAMIRMASNPEIGREFGEKGYLAVRRSFSNSIVVKKIEDLYLSVINQ